MGRPENPHRERRHGAFLEVSGQPQREPHGRGMVWHVNGIRLRVVVRLLVHLPGMIAGVLSAESMGGSISGGVSASAGAASVAQPAASGGISLEGGKGIIPPKLDESGKPLIKDGKTVLDYDLATPMMLVRYFPSGLLGLGLCALMASFMSGMAGNTTAFNSVWTYDIYQGYINKSASDQHYL